MRKIGIIPLGAAQVAKAYTGAMVLLSKDLFHHDAKLIDLLRTNDGQAIVSTETLCQEPLYTDCEDLVIADAVILHPFMLFMTSHGLFRTEDYTAVTSVTFTKVVFRDALSGATISVDPTFPTALHGSNDCMLGGTGHLYLTYSGTGAQRLNKVRGMTREECSLLTCIYTNMQLLISDGTMMLDNKWLPGPSITSLGSYTTAASFVATVYDYSRNVHMLLVGVPVVGCCGISDGRCCYTTATLYHYDGETTSEIFVFPATTVVTGMSYHDDGLNLVAYGRMRVNVFLSTGLRPSKTLRIHRLRNLAVRKWTGLSPDPCIGNVERHPGSVHRLFLQSDKESVHPPLQFPIGLQRKILSTACRTHGLFHL